MRIGSIANAPGMVFVAQTLALITIDLVIQKLFQEKKVLKVDSVDFYGFMSVISTVAVVGLFDLDYDGEVATAAAIGYAVYRLIRYYFGFDIPDYEEFRTAKGRIDLLELEKMISWHPNIKRAILSGNWLKQVPLEIMKWSQLEYLSLAQNCLSSVPSAIGRLQKLRHLNLQANNLTDLPLELAQLSSECRINVEYNWLSAETVERFEVETARVRYLDPTKGPRLRVTIHELPRVSQQPKNLDKKVAWWIKLYQDELHPSHPIATRMAEICAHPQSDLLNQFLDKLEQVKDFIDGGNARKNIIYRAYNMIERAAEHEAFRNKLWDVLKDALGTCNDRVNLAFDKIEQLWYLSQPFKGLNELASLLVSMTRLDLVEKQAWKRIEGLRRGDPIEVLLFYHTKLKAALRLPVSTQHMLHEGVGKVPPELLDEDRKIVVEATSLQIQIAAILMQYEVWEEKIKDFYSSGFNEIKDAIQGLMESDQENEQEKLKKIADLNLKQKNMVRAYTEQWVSGNMASFQIPDNT